MFVAATVAVAAADGISMASTVLGVAVNGAFVAVIVGGAADDGTLLTGTVIGIGVDGAFVAATTVAGGAVD